MSVIFPFASAERPTIDQAGGKALALITMTGEGLPVPPGFVLSVGFFEPWSATLHATPEWATLQNADEETLSQSARALQSLCRGLRFSDEQREALDRALSALQAAGPAPVMAVRSSSPEEDLEGASFAGGYETTLGVRPENLEAAIRHSFASSFDQRVFLYKREHGFPTDLVRIAVIVQQQVDADSAGVAFSLNPLNNCYDEAVIETNYGLGESVVAGEVEPDLFVVDRVEREILDTRIGAKEVVTTLNPDGGTTQSSRAPDKAPCITPDQVLEITALLERVQVYYDNPADIEWAISGKTLYLLQARPVTTYLPLPEEMVTAPGEPKRLYADSTLIEQGVQEPLSVLGTNFLHYIFQVMSGPMGEVPIGIDGITFTAGGRYYMNLSNSLRMMGRNAALAPGSLGDETVLGILDNIDLEQYFQQDLPNQLKAARLKAPLNIVPRLLPVMQAYLRPEAFRRKYVRALPGHLQRFEGVVDPSLSIDQQASNLASLLTFFLMDFGLPMVFAPQIAQSRIKRVFEEDGYRVKEQILSLGIALPGNKTTEMGELMIELASAETIRGHASADSFVAGLEQRTLDPAFLERWDRFVDEFGARCPCEIDVATPRPNEQPGLLYEQLKSMSLAMDAQVGHRTVFEEARAKREEAYKVLHELALQKSKRKARALAKHYRTWITLGGYRETGKHYVIKVIDLFRKRVLEVARTFVQAGRLDHAEQIFDLTIDDIDHALADAALDLRAMAQERTAPIDKIRKSRLVARVIDSRGKIYAPPRKEAGAGELAGVSISPGVVQGRVKVLHRAGEKPLLPGEILVTRATDPGWTPLFIHAGGIVLEIGGALQHGAVVAREYGLPCVSGLTGATELLEDGQMVEVDGTNGIVRILDQEDVLGAALPMSVQGEPT